MPATVATASGWWLLAVAVALCNVVGAGAVLWYAWKTHHLRSALPAQRTSGAPSQSQVSPPAPSAASQPALSPRPGPRASSEPPSTSAKAAQLDAEAARQLLQRLTELTANTASDVGAHSTRMQSVTNQISGCSSTGDGALRESLLAAARQMLEANEHLQAELAQTKAELQQHSKQLDVYMAEARTDALAGIANRRALDEELDRRYATWRRQGTPLSFFIIDADHFKKFNDTYGHQAGDEVLRTIGRVLATSVRDMDFVARYGGEEFAFVLPGTQLDDAKAAAERIRRAIAQAKVTFAGRELQVTVSIGLAEIQPGNTVSAFLKRADMALYAAKSHGRNRTYFHDGCDCLPVDAEAVAARSEVAKAVHQQLIEIEDEEWSSDRRNVPRHKFPRIQSIAPVVDGRLPAADEFQEVQCRDLNSGGLSFWLSSPPQYSTLVIALGRGETVKYLRGEVSHTATVRLGEKTIYLVGCRFTGRLDPLELSTPAAAEMA